MSPKHAAARFAPLLLPGIAVSIAYLAFFAIPQRREYIRVSSTVQQHRASAMKLKLRVDATTTANKTFLAQTPTARSPITREISFNNKEQTFVQAFAVLLAIFDSHGVKCTAANPDSSDTGIKIDSAITHQVSLDGAFGDVLDSMEAIRAKLPRALPTELSMTRPDPLGPCRWKIAFNFEEYR